MELAPSPLRAEPGGDEPPAAPHLAQVPRAMLLRALGILWLVPAAALLLVANGRWMLPAAAWLAPVFLLRFFRSQRTWVAVPLGAIVVIPVVGVAWRGMVPLAGAPEWLVTCAIGLVTLLPLVADRLLARRLMGFGSSLVFPAAAVVVEYLAWSVSPYGTWGSPAYTQTQDLPLMQVVSVTGLWGVSFLIAWFAAVANGLWERGTRDAGARAAAVAFAAVLVAVHLLGGVRLARESRRDTVRVASFSMATDPPLTPADVVRRPGADAAHDALKGRLEGLRASLFARASREAKAGAEIVFWSEANGIVFKADEEDLIADGATLAHDEGVYLGMAFAEVDPGRSGYENRLMIFDPQGQIVSDYRKARPVPGDSERNADRHPTVVGTPYGRLAGAIGFDADFPSLVRDAGESGADILIVPAADRSGSDPLHTRMALVRGIENGCAVVRQASGGPSAAADARGQILASADFLSGKPYGMVAQVPRRGEPTIYARFGDFFAWTCLLLLAVFLGLALRATRPGPAPVAS